MIVGVQDRLPTTDLFYGIQFGSGIELKHVFFCVVLTSLGDMYNSLAEYKKTLEVLNLALSLCSGKRKVVADLHLASCMYSVVRILCTLRMRNERVCPRLRELWLCLGSCEQAKRGSRSLHQGS